MTLAICLLIVAFGLVMAEIAIPSFGILSLLAGLCYAIALWKAFGAGSTEGWSLVGAGVLLLPLAIAIGLKALPRTPFGRRLILRRPEAGEIQHGTLPPELKKLIGKSGVAMSDLRPSGTARMGDERIDVVASGKFLSRGSPVVVVRVDGTRIVVDETEKKDTDA